MGRRKGEGYAHLVDGCPVYLHFDIALLMDCYAYLQCHRQSSNVEGVGIFSMFLAPTVLANSAQELHAAQGMRREWDPSIGSTGTHTAVH